MKSGPLSNAKVIKKISDQYTPLEINITDQGFPAAIPALTLWQKAYDDKASHKVGFATTVVVQPKGRFPLGTSGSGYLGEYDEAINYHTDKYLKFLDESLERGRRAEDLETNPKLTAKERATKHKELIDDILGSIRDANQGVYKKAR